METKNNKGCPICGCMNFEIELGNYEEVWVRCRNCNNQQYIFDPGLRVLARSLVKFSRLVLS